MLVHNGVKLFLKGYYVSKFFLHVSESDFFSNLKFIFSNILGLRNLYKQAFCINICFDVLMFKEIVLVISKRLQIQA